MTKPALFLGLIALGLLTWFVIMPRFMVGTEAWCDYMESRDKSDWSLSETSDYAKHCVFRKD